MRHEQQGRETALTVALILEDFEVEVV